MFSREIVEFYHKNRNEIEGFIDKIISLYGDIEGKCYEIQDVKSAHNGFNVHVSNYVNGWGEEFFDKFIELSIFYDQDLFDDLQEQAERAAVERQKNEDEKRQRELSEKLEGAKEFLKKYGEIQ